jgi:16S rRNA G966 N2-methylase RsmD
MGIEALSRGAHFAWLNDLDKKVFAIVHENVFSLNLETQVTLTNMDAFACLKKIHHEGRKIDMLFLDRPYQRQMIDDMLIYVTEHKLLSSRGIVIIESDKKWDLTPYPFSKVKHYSYGVSIVSIGWTS